MKSAISCLLYTSGAQQPDQASYFTKKLLLWDYIAQGATNALILIFLNPLLRVYTLSDDTRHLAWLLVMIHAGSAIFLWPAGFVPVSYTHLDVYKRQIRTLACFFRPDVLALIYKVTLV